MKKTLAVALFLVFTGTAFAAEPTAESIDLLLASTHADRMRDAVMDSMETAFTSSIAKQTADSIKGHPPTGAQQKIIDELPAKIVAIMRTELSMAAMRDFYLQIYREAFTQEVIDGMVAFYKTPAGAALIEKMPAVMQRTMELMQARMGPMQDKVKAVMQRSGADIKAAE